MTRYRDEAFETYWNRRVKYRHPEENKKELRILAKKVFYVGWETGRFELNKEIKEVKI